MLKDKVIIVTGGGAGIGWGIVRACGDAGARVVLAQRSDSGRDKAEALVANGHDVRFARLDVSKPDQIADFWEMIRTEYDRVDGLVNNAGVTIEADFFTFSAADLEMLWATNQRSIFLMSQEAARIMRKQGSGSIVNVSSNHGTASVPGYEAYAGTKGAISAMTRGMALSLGPHGIRVNTLSPGLTHTESVAQVVEDKPGLQEVFSRLHPTRKWATVEEIGDLAVFMLSDKSGAITGTEILADHGLSAQLCKDDDLK